MAEDTSSSQASQSIPSTPQLLIDHASQMWDAELEEFRRFTNRGRLILVSTTALLGFVSAVAIVARPGERLSEANGTAFVLGLIFLVSGLVLISAGLFGLIRAATIYVNHGEEDAGSLPNPVHFGEIGDRWWVTQPTIDTIEERYLLALCIRRLAWIRKGSNWHRRITMRLKRSLAEYRVKKLRDQLFHALANNPDALQLAQRRYRKFIRYSKNNKSGQNTPRFTPLKNRGPRDMASMIIAIEVLVARRADPRATPKETLKLIERKIGDLVSRVESGRVSKDDFFRAKIDDHNVDLLHPALMVRASSYYLQFSEAFGWLYGGRCKHPITKRNPTGSRRAFSELDLSTTDAFDEPSWRVFISKYFAAQNFRSSNWNLWFRVKRAERRFLVSFWMIFASFLLLSVGEGIMSMLIEPQPTAHYHSGPPE